MVAPNTVIPSYSVVAGRPGVVVDELPETAMEGLECRFSAVLWLGMADGGAVKNIYRMI